MALLELGDRDDVESALRKLFLFPLMVIFPLLFAGLLIDRVPTILAFVIGGAVGGGLGYLLGEGAVRLLGVLWPRKVQDRKLPRDDA